MIKIQQLIYLNDNTAEIKTFCIRNVEEYKNFLKKYRPNYTDEVIEKLIEKFETIPTGTLIRYAYTDEDIKKLNLEEYLI